METNKNKLIMAIALVLTIIAIGAGTTYAYYVINIQGTSTTETITVGSATIGVTYVNGKNIEASNILPGWSDDKLFSVNEVNTTNKTIKYDINVYATSNGFDSAAGELKATLYKGSSTTSYESTALATDVVITSGSSKNTKIYTATMGTSTGTSGNVVYYKLHITYPNLTASQTQGKTFNGYVSITANTTSISN